MPVPNFSGKTFVAFLDISGFKELMKDDKRALEALKHLYQSGYNALNNDNGVEGFFVSDSGVLFVRTGSNKEKLYKMLEALRTINIQMLERNYMLTTSIAFGNFDYQDKLEFDGIDKNPIYGFAYVQAFLDNETGTPKIQPGQCRLIMRNLPGDIDLNHDDFDLLKPRDNASKHLYYYWNLERENQIETFEQRYKDSYQLKYTGMLTALKRENI